MLCLHFTIEFHASAENSKVVDDTDKIESWKSSEIVDSSHIKSLRLPDPMADSKVMQLIYINSGFRLLALASSGIHKLWKWQRMSTASVIPQLWQPFYGAVMSNHLNESKSAVESASCFALSKNDHYVLSASGGKISLFNMITFKVMAAYLPLPPAATYLILQPQDNNIAAIGMEDSTIAIYNLPHDERVIKLEGHQKHITGLAFSQALNSLVSSGADAQASDGWSGEFSILKI